MRRGTKHNRSLRISIISLIIVLLVLVFTKSLFEQGLQMVQKPLVAAGTWVYQRAALFQDSSKSLHELLTAQEQLKQLAFDHVRFQELKKENSELKDALSFIERTAIKAVTASIVSRSSLEGGSIFSVDVGSNTGVSVGDPVIIGDGMFVGKVIRITPTSSTIQTLTHPEMATAVSVLGQTQTIGVAEGMSENLLRLKFIPQDTPIKINDLVVTSGLESQVPSGLIIGLVNDVRLESNAPFLQAVIEPLADIRQYQIVHILIQETL